MSIDTVITQQRPPQLLAEVIPQVKARGALLILSGALLTAALAQIEIYLGFTPVPITGQTLGALLAGGALGAKYGGLSQLLYLGLGLFMPFYAGGSQGWVILSGATGGYLIGMVVAATLVGHLATSERGRRLMTAVPVMLLGTTIIYAFGVPFLAAVTNMSATQAIASGLTPFIVGDTAKAVAAGALLPAAWLAVGKIKND